MMFLRVSTGLLVYFILAVILQSSVLAALHVERGDAVHQNYVNRESNFVEDTKQTLESSSNMSTTHVRINTGSAVRVLNPRFLSVAMAAHLVDERWKGFDFTSERLKTLAKGLSPSYFRLGGNAQDFLLFNETLPTDGNNRVQFKNLTDFTMSVEDWDNINLLLQKVGMNLTFGLNVLHRYHNNSWDPSNAVNLIDYTIKQGYHVNWELGNEPNSFRRRTGKFLDPSLLAKDFITLRGILENKKVLQNCLLIGPDVTNPGKKANDVDFTIHAGVFLDEFLKTAPNVTNITTWHHFDVNGHTAVLDDFINPSNMDTLRHDIQIAKDIVNRYNPDTVMWLGATASAYGGGAPNLSDAYVAGFMWLDKLGISAVHGIDVLMRMSFYHGHYALIDKDLNPNPDYWLSVIYKRLVGSKVLAVEVMNFDLYSNEVTDDNQCVRVYAHCTAGTDYPQGSITTYALSLCKEHTTKIVLSDDLSKLAVDEYLLTPHGDEALTTKRVDLNGKILKMPSDSTLPDFVPRHLQPGDDILIPPLTFGFFVLVDAGVKIC